MPATCLRCGQASDDGALCVGCQARLRGLLARSWPARRPSQLPQAMARAPRRLAAGWFIGAASALVVLVLGLPRIWPASDPAPVRPVGAWQVIAGERGGAVQLSSPLGLAADQLGHLYVVDAGNHQVVKLSPDGRPLGVWGGRGTGPG